MSSFLQDIKYAFRSLTRSPAFTAVAVATLALGIGANAAIFALVDHVLLRLLPVQDPGSLVLLRSPGPSQGHTWSDGDDTAFFSYPMYRDLRDKSSVFSGLLAEHPFAVSLSALGSTERAAGELVSGNYFGILGVPAALGRTLTPADDRTPGGQPVVVLSFAYWQRRFGGEPSILNKTIVVNGTPMLVVGVSGAAFSGIQPGRRADLFAPLMMKERMTPFWNGLDDPKDYWLQIFGRVRPGLSRARAQEGLASLYRALLHDLSPRLIGWDAAERQRFEARRLILDPGGHGRTPLRNDVGTPLISLMAMVALVLLIACSNLAGLLAARGAARQREYGIRLAIGASRFQLIRQSIVECLLFAFLGGALGLLVASWTLRSLLNAFPADADLRQVQAAIDPRVLAFAAIASLFSALFFGVSPALRAARLDPSQTLRGQGRGSVSPGGDVLRFRQWLVTAQIALTLVLLVASGLFVGSLRNLGRVELGLRPDRVIGFALEPKLNGYSAEKSGLLARNLTASLASLPGVRGVSAAELPTLAGSTSGGNLTVAGRKLADGSDRALRNWVGPDYFSTLGIPLLMGREITWHDDASTPKVAVINETAVRRFFAGENPIGARIGFGRDGQANPDIEVVGVVGNSKGAEVGEKDQAYVYAPYLQDARLGSLTFYVRTDREPAALASALRAEVRRADPDLPIFEMKALNEQIHDSLVTQRLIVLLSAAFGGLAALLAAIGIYGVLAFAVAQRRQEIGVRVALGADPAAIRKLILGEVLRFLAIGGAIGLPAAYALARAVQSILYGVGAANVGVFAAGAGLMAAVALAAAWPPAWRAARVSAAEALRSE